MANQNLKSVKTQNDRAKDPTIAIYDIQTLFWQIEALTRTIDFPAIQVDHNLSAEDMANISTVIGNLARNGVESLYEFEQLLSSGSQKEVANG